MVETAEPDDSAQAAYEALAPHYDAFTHRNDYELWFGVLLPALERHGLKKGRLLDVGCGTGRAFGPMLRRGWEIVGCDLSPAMLEEARRKFGDAVPLHVADLRALPVFGEFDLVWALNDVVNYLVDDGDLQLALLGMRANLAPGGLALFDTSTLALLEASFTGGVESAVSTGGLSWRGQEDRVESGGVVEARLSGDDLRTHSHRQRHHTAERVRSALEAADLDLLSALGQHEEVGHIALAEEPDEQRDNKVIYIARRPL